MPDRPRTDRARRRTDEAREALDAVLYDQAARQHRRHLEAGARRRGAMTVAVSALVLAVVSVSLWTSPPPWVSPPEIPEPSPWREEAGLRMDMWKAVERIRGFQSDRGRLPVYLWEAVEPSPEATDLSYTRTSPEAFRLTGRRGPLEVDYTSATPLDQLVGPAIEMIRDGESGR